MLPTNYTKESQNPSLNVQSHAAYSIAVFEETGRKIGCEKVVPPPPNLMRSLDSTKIRKTAYQRVSAALRQHYLETGEILSADRAAQQFNTSKRTASLVVRHFRMSLERGNFAYSSNAIHAHLFRVEKATITRAERKLMTEAEFTLLDRQNLWCITLVCPADTDLAFLVLNQESQSVSFWFITLLLASLKLSEHQCFDKPNFYYRAELQACGRLHVHIWLELPNIAPKLTSRLQRYAKRCWYWLLNDLGDRYGIDLFLSKSGKQLRYTDDFCHVIDWNETTQRDHGFVYGAHEKNASGRYIKDLQTGSGDYIHVKDPVYVSIALKRLINKHKKVSRYELTEQDARTVVQLFENFGCEWITGQFAPNGHRIPDTCRIHSKNDQEHITSALQCLHAASTNDQPHVRKSVVIAIAQSGKVSIWRKRQEKWTKACAQLIHPILKPVRQHHSRLHIRGMHPLWDLRKLPL